MVRYIQEEEEACGSQEEREGVKDMQWRFGGKRKTMEGAAA